MKGKIITIAREYASGGHQIGELLAKKLGVPMYDKEIISMTAKKSGFSEQIVADVENKKTGSLLYGLYMSSLSLPLSDQVYIAQSKVIRDIADRGPCVIIGRCADYVLRENEDSIHVFIHAPIEARIKRAREEYRVEDEEMEAYVRKMDKSRAAYYNFFTQNKWGVARHYHMTLDSSIGIDKCVCLIEQLAQGER